MVPSLFALALTLGTTAALAAGQVEVRFKPLDELSDVGRGLDRERNVKAIADHFQSLAAQLPDGQRLSVEVLDVDMAGELRPLRRADEMRVMKGAADWPKLELKWTLTAGGQALKSGQERLSDMAYLQQPLRGGETSPVAYETRLIDRWFEKRVIGSKADPR